MSKFKPGDRVRVFVGGHPDIAAGVRDGEVVCVMADGTIDVRFGAANTWLCHPKQCRRLVKRKRREIWAVDQYGDLKVLSVFSTKEMAYGYAAEFKIKSNPIRFVEAKEK